MSHHNEQYVSIFDDFLHLIVNSRKLFAICLFLGFIFSLIYLVITPKKYEGNLQILVARIQPNVNLIDPSKIVAELVSGDKFYDDVSEGCTLGGGFFGPKSFNEIIKFTAPNSMPSILEVSIVQESPDLVKSCAETVSSLIAKIQDKAVIDSGYVEEYRKKLAQIDSRINLAQSFYSQMSGNDKEWKKYNIMLRQQSLEDDRTNLIKMFKDREKLGMQIISSSVATPGFVAPRKSLVFCSGLCGGFLLAFLIALLRGSIIKTTLKNVE